MNDDLKKEAASKLEDIISNHRFDKSGEDLLKEICDFYRLQSDSCKSSIEEVFEDWLLSADKIKAGWAIDLISKLQITKKLSLLQDTLRAVKDGKSKLPSYYVEFLEPAIKDMQNNV